MTRVRILPLFFVLVVLLVGFTSALLLDRLPHRNPSYSNRFVYQDTRDDDDDFADSEVMDPSMDEKRSFNNDLRSSWKSLYPFSPQDLPTFRSQRKRETRPKDIETSEKEKHELANILKDDDEEKQKAEDKKMDKKIDPKDKKESKHGKTKRQSNDDSEHKIPETKTLESEEAVAPSPAFQDWLRREYYRNMAKSFASMRRKRDGSSAFSDKTHKQQPLNIPTTKQRPKKSVSFKEVTDSLKDIEDVLFMDALQTIKDAGEDYDDDPQKQNRIAYDLSSAYDLETMRNALIHLRETLSNLEQPMSMREQEEEPIYKAHRKRGDQCAPLDLLTSDCSTLGDIVSDGPLKRLLLHACNWHEVCYTCGEVYGLTSENCDVGFIEQSQTICHGDVPCESTASLLLLPLRQRRVFYKRSNPSVCLLDPCVEDFLKQGQQ